MAKRCEICDKGTATGRKISHAHNVTSRTFEANLQKVRAWIDGRSRRVWACTRCIRSGRVQKPPVRSWQPEADAAQG
jgi:large subunit ribosomal protein L28